MSAFGSGLVVTYQKLEGLLQLPSHWQVEHFGNLRGINAHENKTFCLIVGRNEPTVRDVETIARCFLAPKEALFQSLNSHEFAREQRGYTLRNGNQAPPVETSFHPDPRGDRILQQIRECETIQGACRTRDIYRDGKIIFNLSNVPIDMEVDGNLSFHELMRQFDSPLAEVFSKYDVVPKNAAWLQQHFPQFWKDERAVKNYLDRHFEEDFKNLTFVLDTLNTKLRFFGKLEFSRASGQKRASVCYSKLSPQETQKRLEMMFGCEIKMRSPRVVEEAPPPRAEGANICECGGEIWQSDHFCHDCYTYYGPEDPLVLPFKLEKRAGPLEYEARDYSKLPN